MNVVFFENKALIILQSLVWRRWRTLSEVQMSSLQPTSPVRPAAAVGSAGVFFRRRRWASAAHRVMYGQCVGWKSSLVGSSGPPNMRQKRDNWQRFHSRCLCYNSAYGILSQSLLPRKRDFPVICGSQSSKRDLSFLKMDFWDFVAAGNPEAGNGLTQSLSADH